MGRLIDTDDLNNRLQAYSGFGMFRGNILSVVEDIIMDCPTVTDCDTRMKIHTQKNAYEVVKRKDVNRNDDGLF